MEMVVHEDEPEKSAFSDSTDDATVRGDASRSRSGEDSEVPAAAPGVKLYRQAAVGFGLLCILLAVLIIALPFILHTEARCKKLTEERDELERELKTSVSQSKSLTEERDKLKRINSDTEARCKKLTEERDELERELKTSVSQSKSLTEERDKLKRINSDTEARCKKLTEERDELERELKTSVSQYNSLTEERDKLKRAMKTTGWVYFSNSVYYMSSTKKTWQGSRDDCLQKGADLMIIDSKEEQDFMRHLKGNVWIGLSDRETEGTWRWVDGTPLETSYWLSGEPNDHFGKEDCGELLFHTMEENWNDKSCDHSNFWVCEMKLPP